MPNYNLKEGSVQMGFNKSRAGIQIFGGAFGNGKTTALVIKALGLVKDYPGCRGLLGRETYPKLNDTLRYEFLRWCPAAWIKKKPTQDDNSCYFVNGSSVHFRYISQRGKTREDGTTASNLLSASYDWIGIDQIEDPGIQYKDFLDMLGRLRGDTPYRPTDDEDKTMPSKGPQWLMLTSNPAHNWFYHEVIHPYIVWRDRGLRTEKLIVDEDTGKPILDLFESDIYANKDNLGEGYIKKLESTYKGQMRERFLLGKWAAFEGLVHPDFDYRRHVITKDQALGHLAQCRGRGVQVRVIEGYDFGVVSPSCYLLGFVDDYGRVILIDGYYQAGLHVNDQPQMIEEVRARYAGQLFPTEKIIADPAIFKRSVVNGQNRNKDTIAKIYKDADIPMVPGSNDVLSGIAKVNAYLNGQPGTPHITGVAGVGPLLYVVEDLQFFMDEIASYYWKRNPQGDRIDEPIDKDDHAMNVAKYMLSKLPEPSKIISPDKLLPPKWKFWQEMDDDQYRMAQMRMQ